jgi:hypothetical protein
MHAPPFWAWPPGPTGERVDVVDGQALMQRWGYEEEGPGPLLRYAPLAWVGSSFAPPRVLQAGPCFADAPLCIAHFPARVCKSPVSPRYSGCLGWNWFGV